MAHKFVKQQDGSKVCEWCADEKDVDKERDCPRSQQSGFLEVNFQPIVDASLILSFEIEVGTVKGKKKSTTIKRYTASGVAISSKRALTALHGTFELGTPVKVTTRKGIALLGHVEFERFAVNIVDIATIVLEESFEFVNFVEWSDKRVHLTQPLVVVGLKYGSAGDAVCPYARVTHVDMIEEFYDDSTLFQASYYSFDGCSGAGLITVVVDNVPKIVGVHIASHEDSSASKKRKRNPSFANFEAEVQSAIHGHKAYSLVCEIARVPDLIDLLNNS